jgi:hypothetical protein
MVLVVLFFVGSNTPNINGERVMLHCGTGALSTGSLPGLVFVVNNGCKRVFFPGGLALPIIGIYNGVKMYNIVWGE